MLTNLIRKVFNLQPDLNKSIKEFLKEEPVGLHNALNDMMYCKRIFFELRHQNLIEEH